MSLDVLFDATSLDLAPDELLDDPEQRPVAEAVPLLPMLGLRIDRVEQGLAARVMDACEPRGTLDVPRPWACRYGFFRENAPNRTEHEPWHWDPDQAIYSAVALSRIVQPNVICTKYSARLIETDGGALEIHPGPVTGQSSDAWLQASLQKRWLARTDAETLGVVLRAYWPIKETWPWRLRRALWNHEYAAQTKDPNVRLVLVSTALEALVHTDRYRSTAQFRRIAPLAGELGVAVGAADADEAYELRSHVAHGDRLATRLHPHDAARRAAEEARMEALALTLEEVLRKAIRRGIEDAAFCAIFEDSGHIRARWPL